MCHTRLKSLCASAFGGPISNAGEPNPKPQTVDQSARLTPGWPDPAISRARASTSCDRAGSNRTESALNQSTGGRLTEARSRRILQTAHSIATRIDNVAVYFNSVASLTVNIALSLREQHYNLRFRPQTHLQQCDSPKLLIGNINRRRFGSLALYIFDWARSAGRSVAHGRWQRDTGCA